MAKPSDDLSALFRSLRPDESVFQETSKAGAREAQQRWPLFNAVAPQKPEEVPPLSTQERQRWANLEKPEVGARKPALSLPGLSDKMSKGLGKMSVQAVKNTATVKPATRWELEKYAAEPVTGQAVERTLPTPISVVAPFPQANMPANRTPAAAPVPPVAPAVDTRSSMGVFDRKPAVPAPAPALPMAERDLPIAGRNGDSLKNVFSRLEGKPEIDVKPVGKRSSFLDRLGKR